ncbi:long-chain fatty acid--CoA ligase [Tessaracoccus rhinocerotis]|uniref:Acyl-CoA synthetase n=1 Tax=Tessaracoccus rhinocerotis TaxID=1689449 RepID=A0A553K0B3_9ACTN|nr:long-chain fatty acid--CoA ligase [Tessaracoccus rhinocerotis]TRY18146.1 long-chain fatty acid--CoA ligase [Tessaracoccus rhinocerotis]
MIEHLAVRLRGTVAAHADRTATRIRRDDAWETQTFAQFGRKVDEVAQGLLDLGIEPGDRIGLFAANSPEWSEIDFGALTARAVPVPLYSTSTPEQIRHIAGDSDVRVMFVGGRSEAERLLEVTDELPALERVVVIEPWEPLPEGVVSYDDFRSTPDDGAIAARLNDARGEDLASIIYTSGTTGDPKGVMLEHQALIKQKEALEELFSFGPEDHSLAFLPLSHALERAWTTVVLLKGCMNTYVANARTVAEQMVLAKPTLMVSVPKLYETVFATAHAKVASSAVKRRIFSWALRVGAKNQHAYRQGRTPSPWWRAQLPLADKLVLGNVRDALGGPKTVLACGGAPIRKEIEEFFSAVGMPVSTGYGLTEASPLVSFNSPEGFKIGTAGRVMKGSELKIGEYGEILYRGPNVMAGYWRNQEATDEAIVDGWLHTGDAGYVDTDGYLVITDRIKDIIVTLGGKNVAPQPIEGLILSDPLFEHAVLLGDNRPFITLLVKPSLPQVEELAKIGDWPGEVADWLKSNELREELRRRVEAITAHLPSQDRPKETAVMDEDLTMENGLLTPTLKVRRRQVEEKFKAAIEEMYTRLERLRKGE